MGWCSGTDVFDPVAKKILEMPQLKAKTKIELLKVLIEALEHKDWDCESDSAYYDNPLVQLAFEELHPEWQEDNY